MGILFNKKGTEDNKQKKCYREVSSNDFILRFEKDFQFNIKDYPKLKKSGMWSSYAGNCYRGFSPLSEEELYTLFCEELKIDRSQMKVIYATPFGAPSTAEN